MVFAGIFLLGINRTTYGYYALGLFIVSMILDAVDGPIARWLGYDDEVGKLTDLYSDHITANTLWAFFSSVGLISIWVTALASARDSVVDLIRQAGAARTGQNGFQLIANAPFAWLSKSRPMRFFYGTLKCVVWSLAALEFMFTIELLAGPLAWFTLAVCMIRAIPYLFAGWKHIVFFPRKVFANSSTDETQGPERINGSFFIHLKSSQACELASLLQ